MLIGKVANIEHNGGRKEPTLEDKWKKEFK